MWQRGDRLLFRPGRRGPFIASGDTLLATLVAADPRIAVAAETEGWGIEHDLESGDLPCPSLRSPLVLISDRQRVDLRPFVRPEWARRAGRDRRGLWAEAEADAEVVCLRWRDPKLKGPRVIYSDPGAERVFGPNNKWLEPGGWEGEEWPGWASAAGRDRFGLWTAVEVGDVSFRLRWIHPGHFWMGSPEGRWHDARHEVTLTCGFWLGETACTQALWEAVDQEESEPISNAGPARRAGELGRLPGVSRGAEPPCPRPDSEAADRGGVGIRLPSGNGDQHLRRSAHR